MLPRTYVKDVDSGLHSTSSPKGTPLTGLFWFHTFIKNLEQHYAENQNTKVLIWGELQAVYSPG